MTNDLVFEDPCLVFAMRREAIPFFREFRPHQRFPGAPCWARFCGPSWLSVLVVVTGMGQQRMEQALRWVLGKPVFGKVPYQPKVVLSAGISGGLDERYQSGDIILATEVVDAEGRRWRATWPGDLPPGEWRPPLHRGALISVPALVCGCAEKRYLGGRLQAVAVDMETAAVARLCSKQGVPFGCVRAIADDVHTALPARLSEISPDGRIRPLKILTGILRSPRLAGELWRLDRQARLATRQLAIALGELLTLTLP
jgi:adenosylhomocysteine nucleosidase